MPDTINISPKRTPQENFRHPFKTEVSRGMVGDSMGAE